MTQIISWYLLYLMIIFLFGEARCLHQFKSTEEETRVSLHQKPGDWVVTNAPQSGILIELPTMSIEKEEALESTSKCFGYQPDVNNVNNFQVFAFGHWVSRKCHFGLIWNQEKCQCDWKPAYMTELEESSQNKCDLTFNLTFDGHQIRDHAKNTFIQVDSLTGTPIKIKDEVSNINRGLFNFSRLTIHFFAGNSYSNMFQMKIRFKPEINTLNTTPEVSLISNACTLEPNVTEPTIALKISPKRQELYFVINGYAETASLNTTQYHRWHNLTVSFVKGAVKIFDYNQIILNSTNYPAFVNLSQCPLFIGGEPNKPNESFHGFIQSILLWRQCPEIPERKNKRSNRIP